MNRFYLMIDLEQTTFNKVYTVYQDSIFVGVSFRDQQGLTVKTSNQHYNYNLDYGTSTINSTSISIVCGRETDTSSGWMPVGGPIKGFYMVKNG